MMPKDPNHHNSLRRFWKPLQPEHDNLLEALNEIQPQARPEFQSQLEAQLMAQLAQQIDDQTAEEIFMSEPNEKVKARPLRRKGLRNTILLLIAAFLLIVIGAAYQSNLINQRYGYNSYLSVYIAVVDIEPNTIITADMLESSVISLRTDSPLLREQFSNGIIHYAEGLITTEFIPQGEIIRAPMIHPSSFPSGNDNLTITIVPVQALRGQPTVSPPQSVDAFQLTATALVAHETQRVGAETGCATATGLEGTHTVIEGDTLFAIAETFHTTPDVLVVENCLASVELVVGQTLRVPFIDPATLQQRTQAAVLEDVQRTANYLTRSAMSPTPAPTATLTPTIISTP